MVQRLGAANNLRNMVNVLREISFDDIRDDAERRPKVLVVGPSVSDARSLGYAVFGAGEGVEVRDRTTPIGDLDQLEVVIVDERDRDGGAAEFMTRLRSLPAAPPIVRVAGGNDPETDFVDGARREIVRRLPDRAPAFGRAFAAMRPAASKAVIDETAIANAQFALVSNIPAILPVIGSIAAAGADFIVLTKNQVMMIYKLAAIHGRNLADQVAIVQEVVPVVGVGFAWRSLARGAAAWVPFAAGTIPKVAIAFGGTVVMGRAAEYYYRTNRRPSREQLEAFAKQAESLVGRIVGRQVKNNGSGSPPPNGDHQSLPNP